MPKGSSFKWHDHTKMNGFSKCAFGKIRVNSLDLTQINMQEGLFSHPKERIRS